MSHRIAIDYLADRPEAVDELAVSLYAEWFFDMGRSLEEVAGVLERRMNRDRLPLGLVAMVGDQAIGTACLMKGTSPDQQDTVDCLAGVYVMPSWRRHGVGSLLCRRAIEEARRLQLPRLAVYTIDQKGFYARLGWQKQMDALVDWGDETLMAAYLEVDPSRAFGHIQAPPSS